MKVKFLPQDLEFEIEPNQSILDLAQKKGVFIKSICNGLPSCSECRVTITEGDTNVAPPSAQELSLIGTGYYIDQRRLACQLICFGDVVVDLTEQIEKEKMGPKKSMGGRERPAQNPSRAVTGSLIADDENFDQLSKNSSPNPPKRSRPRNRKRSGSQQNQKTGQKQAGEGSLKRRPLSSSAKKTQ